MIASGMAMGMTMLGAILHDPLLFALLIFAVAALLTHLLFRRHPLRRAAVRVLLLAALTILLLHAGVLPYRKMTATGMPVRDAVHGALKIAWWLWAAWFLVGVLRALVVTEHRPREGKLVQDLLAGLVYIAALFAIIAYVFDLPIQGLLATSGAVAIILGLALQSTLSDVFSGIVLNFSRPYRPGDWISIDGATDGQGDRDELAGDPGADRPARSGDRSEQRHRQGQDRQFELAFRDPRDDRDGSSRRQDAARGRRRDPRTGDHEFAADPGDTGAADHRQVDHRELHRVRHHLLRRGSGSVEPRAERAVRSDFAASGGGRHRPRARPRACRPTRRCRRQALPNGRSALSRFLPRRPRTSGARWRQS